MGITCCMSIFILYIYIKDYRWIRIHTIMTCVYDCICICIQIIDIHMKFRWSSFPYSKVRYVYLHSACSYHMGKPFLDMFKPSWWSNMFFPAVKYGNTLMFYWNQLWGKHTKNIWENHGETRSETKHNYKWLVFHTYVILRLFTGGSTF